jgi:hypothetical protein
MVKCELRIIRSEGHALYNFVVFGAAALASPFAHEGLPRFLESGRLEQASVAHNVGHLSKQESSQTGESKAHVTHEPHQPKQAKHLTKQQSIWLQQCYILF